MSRQYMKGIEFKSRQLWLDFECATSIALRVMADSIENMRKWFKEWKKKPAIKPTNPNKWLWIELENMKHQQ
ncbi:MAG: hypothetical protein ACO1N8_11360 [Methylophilus sp.]